MEMNQQIPVMTKIRVPMKVNSVIRWLLNASIAGCIVVGVVLMRPNNYIEAKAFVSQILLKSTWVINQRFDSDITPWPWADTFSVAELTWLPGTKKTIDVKSDSWIVLNDANMRNLAFGPSKLAVGASNNSVIFGHRDTHFSFLQNVELGDTFVLSDRDTEKHFRVSEMAIVNEMDTGVTANTQDSAITLITCYPFDQKTPTSRRFVVRAEFIESTVMTRAN